MGGVRTGYGYANTGTEKDERRLAALTTDASEATENKHSGVLSTLTRRPALLCHIQLTAYKHCRRAGV